MLDKGFTALAEFLQEAATALSHDDIRNRLAKSLSDKHSGSGEYAYPLDVFGDDESGDVVYASHKGMKRAPYTMGTANGNPTCDVECEAAEPVMPRTSYETPADEDDVMTAMERDGLYQPGTAKFIERFISKSTRDNMDAGDFAGKGKSFPIQNQTDVDAAFHALGRAGSGNYSTSKIRSNIIAIAKRKGLKLPKSAQDGAEKGGKESAGTGQSKAGVSGLRSVDLTGDTVPLREGAVGQDGTAHLKLISPGWGSSGYYPPEVLERDGPSIFKKGTKNFWNHQTEAEEASRPEGDLRDLASVLTEDARYDKNGPAGPGLYAKAKVFEQFRQPVDDLAKYIGMSIRANGRAKEGTAAGRTGPIIQELTRGISVDYVTTPGAGGKILQLFEAARAATSANADISANAENPTDLKEAATDMDAAEIKKLQEGQAALVAENRKLRERFALADAATEARKYFDGVQVAEAVRERVLGRALAGAIPLTEAGDLDTSKLTAIVERETQDELAYISKLSGGKIVTGMGTAAQTQQLTEAQIAEAKKADEAVAKKNASWLGLQTDAAKSIFSEGANAFDPNYNSRIKEVTH